ncbi:MAG: ATP-binding domain-containing protein [Zoogloeaceae bacterium]|jgi:superfamily I DNA and RNA helicase|nr:ATP-binding domain-containing protein [Zoogloeaceae bacterium]
MDQQTQEWKSASWREEGIRSNNSVLIGTVQRFKGLESPIVILWGLDVIDLARSEELRYVGMSRAKPLLIVVGTAATCAAFKGVAPTPRNSRLSRQTQCAPRQ